MLTRIDAENLIIGDGELVKSGSVVIEGNKITYAGETEHAPEIQDIKLTNTLMPGLWECHGHYVGVDKLDFQADFFTSNYVNAMRVVEDARRTLKAGVTSVREVAGYGVHLNKVIAEGTVIGPRIYSSNGMLSITGGHGDIHAIPWPVWNYLCSNQDSWWYNTVDGVPECLKGVRKQLRAGAELIKIHASGGVLSEIDDPIHQQFSYEEVKTIVDEAARSEVLVAAHCHGKPGIMNALKAGVKTIEHGSYLDDEAADLMIEKDAILVPTRFIIEESMKVIETAGIPEYGKIKMKQTADRHLEALKIAIKKGVTIAMGTDIAGSVTATHNKWGENPAELELYVKVGMSPMDAIVTATGNGPKTLGPRAPLSGMLKTGYDADLLLLKSNPLDDISTLQNSENLTNVVRSGIFY